VIDNSIARQGQQNVLFHAQIPEVEVFSDGHLERVFDRLFENAIRHGEKVRTITIHASRKEQDLVIMIEDDGTGIKTNEKEKLFDLVNDDARNAGYYIAREILSVTGLTLRETGEYGKGARFEIVIPEQDYRTTNQQ
jgi:K+-sensing histidine kinase KdpD